MVSSFNASKLSGAAAAASLVAVVVVAAAVVVSKRTNRMVIQFFPFIIENLSWRND